MKDYYIFSLRIPDDLHERIKEQAEKEKRSINTMIIITMEKYLDDEDKKKDGSNEK